MPGHRSRCFGADPKEQRRLNEPNPLASPLGSFGASRVQVSLQINGKIYEPDNEWNVDGDVNKARKLPGYTEWIDLPVDSEFCIDFYIPSWATEGDKHVVMFRVAPENVVDHRGVDHLEQEDF